jgi:hypothetical protein
VNIFGDFLDRSHGATGARLLEIVGGGAGVMV